MNKAISTLVVTAMAGFAPQAKAQIIVPPFDGHNYFFHQDQAGDAPNLGTPDHDHFQDGIGGDSDRQTDGPLGASGDYEGSDGVRDWLDTYDGDSNDVMQLGVEDDCVGDNDDIVEIYSSPGAGGPGKCLWKGTWRDYIKMKCLFQWSKDRVQVLQDLIGWAGDPNEARDILVVVAYELVSLAPEVGSDPIGTVYTLGPYVTGTPPAFAINLPYWLPSEEYEKLASTSESMTLTESELDAAVLGTLDLLVHAYDSIYVPQTPPNE